jgi:ribA/ribD-fused uncharacterized protein
MFDRDSLIKAFGCSTQDPILFFQDEYRFLSNFWMCTLVIDGLTYKSSEHYFMSEKTFDEEAKDRIRATPTAAKAKQEGRKVALRADWEEVKVDAMYRAVYAKFSQNPGLKAQLLATGDRYLEEGNTWNDVTWGVCLGEGKNLLGQILMAVRAQLRMSA